MKESADVTDLSPPAQFRTLSDNEDDDDDDDEEEEGEEDGEAEYNSGVKERKKPFCRFVLSCCLWLFSGNEK